VLYEDKEKGEMTCFLKWEPGAVLPMHKHPEIEQTYVIEGSFYDHDGICRAGEFVWRRVGSFHETRSDEGAVILAVYRRPNVFQHGSGYTRGARTDYRRAMSKSRVSRAASVASRVSAASPTR
jgi:anti-sigma factor ChrR (cupin superfamily)